MVYMASCGGPCTDADSATLEWFKIDETGEFLLCVILSSALLRGPQVSSLEHLALVNGVTAISWTISNTPLLSLPHWLTESISSAFVSRHTRMYLYLIHKIARAFGSSPG